MALKMRLARAGTRNRPFYRIVVAEATAPRDGRFVEKVGTYDPLLPGDRADRVTLVEDRIRHWLSVGVQPTERVALFLGRAQIIPARVQPNRPQKAAPGKKAQERLKEAAARAEAAAKEAEAKRAAAEAPVSEGSEASA